MSEERYIDMRPAFDRRDPDPKQNYGIASVKTTFVLKRDGCAVQFALLSGWYLPEVEAEFNSSQKALSHLMASDLGYHSPRPTYDGQPSMEGECHIIGGTCYYDGSTLNAEPVLDLLLREGSEAVWEKLESYYAATFQAAEVSHA